MCKKSLVFTLLIFLGGNLFSQTFWEEDLNNGVPSNWTIVDEGNSNATWEHVNDYNGNDLDGTPFMVVSSDNAGGGDTLVEKFVSPSANTSGADNLYIGFDQYLSVQSSERAYIDVWDGSTWQQVKSYGSSKGAWVNPHEAEIDISAHRNANLKVRFRYEDKGTWGFEWAIDNLKLWNKKCFEPTNIEVVRVDANSAYITWDSNYPNNADWQVIFGKSGFTPNDTITTSNDTTAIGPLNANTEYQFWVREICINGDTSDFVGPYSFTTRCNTVSVPYQEDMETFSVNWDATGYQCWIPDPMGTSSDYRWNTESGETSSSSTGPETDHTTGTNSGIYAYTEASDGSGGDIATLSSSKLDLNNIKHPIMTFWYHRYGNDMGELHLDISTDNGKTWEKDVMKPLLNQNQTSKSDPWKQQYVDLSKYKGDIVLVRFRAVKKSGFGLQGDMAIDDIEIREASDRDLKVLSIPSPSEPGCFSNNHPVELLVVNGGLDSIDLNQTNLDLTVEVTGVANQTFTTTVTNNSLNGGQPLGTLDSIVVPMGNLNMSSNGFYRFEGYVNSINGDTVPINDTIVKIINKQSQSGGNVTGGRLICQGDTAKLSVSNHYGTVQWQKNDGSGWVDVPATGNDSTSYQEVPTDSLTRYRVEVCGSNLSTEDTVIIDQVDPPTAINDSFCKGIDTKANLAVQGTGNFFWYDKERDDIAEDTGASQDVNVKYVDKTKWVSRAVPVKDKIVVTEMDHGNPDAVEIQNVSGNSINVDGWTVALNDDINIDDWGGFTSDSVQLTGTMNSGEIRAFDENANNVNMGWISNDEGWVMILDDNGNMVDWAPFGWTESEVKNFNTTVAGYSVNSSNQWSGPAITSCGSSNNFQRIGNSDNDVATDWICTTNKTMGSQNADIDIPFIGCESEKTPVTAYAEDCTGITSFEDERSFSLFPNPAGNRFFLRVSEGKALEGTLRIRDLEGRILKEERRTLESGKNRVNANGLAKGVYMISFQSEEGSFTKKLVIR